MHRSIFVMFIRANKIRKTKDYSETQVYTMQKKLLSKSKMQYKENMKRKYHDDD